MDHVIQWATSAAMFQPINGLPIFFQMLVILKHTPALVLTGKTGHQLPGMYRIVSHMLCKAVLSHKIVILV